MFKSKPWITPAIQKSITFKNNLLNIKNLSFDIPKSLSSNGSTITNQLEISINTSYRHLSNFPKKKELKTPFF